MWWTSSSGRIVLRITKRCAADCSRPGQNDVAVTALSWRPAIRKQLDTLSPYLLVEELREYGAWDDHELYDVEQNRQRLLWVACSDITLNP